MEKYDNSSRYNISEIGACLFYVVSITNSDKILPSIT